LIDGTIGVRYARGCHPDDLWTKYFTSSKHVRKFREENGEPDVIEIRQTFNDSLQAREWEEKVLIRLKVIYNDKWLNKATGKSIPPQFGRYHSNETKKKISNTRIEIQKKDPSILSKRIESYRKTCSSWLWRKKKSESVIKSCTNERNQRVAKGVSASWENQEDKKLRCQKISEAKKTEEYRNSQRCSCIICHKETNKVGLTRFHKHVS